MADEVSLIIRIRDRATAVLRRVGGGFRRLRDTAGRALAGIARRMLDWRAVIVGTVAVVGLLGAALRKAFEFETLEVQFSVLLKSTELAKQRMQELADFSAKTPFELPQIANASQQLTAFSGGVLGAVASMTLVGDAAAAMNRDIGEVSFWVGRVYAAIKGGEPFGEATRRLQELTIITPETSAKMRQLRESGASNVEIWDVLADKLAEAKGGMEQLSKTGTGLESTLRDNVGLVLKDIGEIFAPAAKKGIEGVIAALGELREDGTIERWADKIIHAFELVERGAKEVKKAKEEITTGRGDILGDLPLVRLVRKMQGKSDEGSLREGYGAFSDEEIKKASAKHWMAVFERNDAEIDATKKKIAEKAKLEEDAEKERTKLVTELAISQHSMAMQSIIDDANKAQKQISEKKAKVEKEKAEKAIETAKSAEKQKLRDAAALQKEGVRDALKVDREIAAVQIKQAEDLAKEKTTLEERLRLRRTDPAAFRRLRQEERRAARDAANLAGQEERALALHERGGRLTGFQQRILEERRARKAAQQALDDAKKVRAQMAKDAAKSAVHLAAIDKNLKDSLTMMPG